MSKKFLVQLTVFVSVFIFILIFNEERAFVANSSDLNKMMNVVQKNDGNVTEWSAFAREHLDPLLTESQFMELAEKWKKQYPHFNWEHQTNKDRLEFNGTYEDPNLQYSEKLQIVANLNEITLQGFVLYELKGSEWNEETMKMFEEKNDKFLPQIFQKAPIVFSSVKGNFSDMNNSALENALKLTNDLNGKIIEELAEEDFVSLTAVSNDFNNHLPSENGLFNLQISVRNSANDEKATFVIGTPILTIEY